MKKSGRMMHGVITCTGRRRIRRQSNASTCSSKTSNAMGPLDGIGEPEALKGSLQGEFSRRINEKDRLVYHIEGDRIYIAACRGHYDDK